MHKQKVKCDKLACNILTKIKSFKGYNYVNISNNIKSNLLKLELFELVRILHHISISMHNVDVNLNVVVSLFNCYLQL